MQATTFQRTPVLPANSLKPGSTHVVLREITQQAIAMDNANNVFGLILLLGLMTQEEATDMYIRDYGGTREDVPATALTFNRLTCPARPVRPDDGATQGQMTTHHQALGEYTNLKAAYDAQMALVASVKRDLAAALPPDRQQILIAALPRNLQTLGLANALTMPQLMDEIRDVTKDDADSLAATMLKVNPTHTAGANPAPAIALIMTGITELNASAYTSPNMADQFGFVMTTFKSDLVLFAAMTTYLQAHPIPDRILQALVKVVQAAYDSAQTIGRHTTGQFGYAAAATALQKRPAAPPTGLPTRPHPLAGQPRPYCWTHGYCAHDSAACKTKAAGHQLTATGANKLGGSVTGNPTF